jgi:hypothetical protein
MDRGGVGDKRESKEMDGCPLTASHLHNEFVKWLALLKNDIEVSVYVQIS